jgi:hypothetical protein
VDEIGGEEQPDQAVFPCRDRMPYENGRPIRVARGLEVSIGRLWPEIKRVI